MFYSGIPIMINSNHYIENCGKGYTVFWVQSIILKFGSTSGNNWYGYMVHIKSIQSVEYLLCEHNIKHDGPYPERFKFVPESDTFKFMLSPSRVYYWSQL